MEEDGRVTMAREIGDRTFPIWLLGDSNPKNWSQVLDCPLDPRHSARHTIWTAVLDVIQDKVFRTERKRLDASRVYIRNAVGEPANKPDGKQLDWSQHVEREISDCRRTVRESKPTLIFSFGAFAFEFGRRVLEESPEWAHRSWTATILGKEFLERTGRLDPSRTNLVPLLHITVGRGPGFISNHDNFCGKAGANYYSFAGNRIAETLLKQPDLQIWLGADQPGGSPRTLVPIAANPSPGVKE